MRKRMKKILAGFLALVMVATSVQLGTVTTKAAEVSIRPGTPVLASQSGKVKTFSFDNVVANSDSIEAYRFSLLQRLDQMIRLYLTVRREAVQLNSQNLPIIPQQMLMLL